MDTATEIVVGSKALEYFGVSPRQPRDIDLWRSGEEEPHKDFGYEIHYLPKGILDNVPTQDGCATPEAVLTIKCSHANWDVHWRKTMSDIAYLQGLGFKKIPELYQKLYAYWPRVHGGKDYLSLDKTRQEFFTDAVTYHIDHDRLHELVTNHDKPVYTEVLKDGQEVLVDKDKFAALPRQKQLDMFHEEVYVIAAERWLIPREFKMSALEAYYMALKKTIVHLTKNWAHEFMVDNYRYYRSTKSFNWLINLKDEVKHVR